eukprot:scaffold231861_cov35-Attheya_sp.AAC.1
MGVQGTVDVAVSLRQPSDRCRIYPDLTLIDFDEKQGTRGFLFFLGIAAGLINIMSYLLVAYITYDTGTYKVHSIPLHA